MNAMPRRAPALLALIFGLLILPGVNALAQTRSLVLDTVATGLGELTSMVFVAPDSALLSSRDGTLRRVDLPAGRFRPVSGAPIPLNLVEAGTLDLVLHPEFDRTRQVFMSLVTGERSSNGLVVMRARIDGDGIRDTATILVTATRDSGVAHYGGQLVFRDGYLYVSNGDRHNRPRVQDLAWHTGKILRVDVDGRAPGDNPFVGRPGALPETWSYGHRNVQGLAFDSERGVLWAHEHGPRNGDEVNQVGRGRDFGWPRISFGWEYEGGPIGAGLPVDSASIAPAWVWTPTVAPSGLHVYSGQAIVDWRGNLLSGTLHARNGQHLNRLVWNGERFILEERLYAGQLGRVRFVIEDHRGWIYLGNDEGQLLRIRPAGVR
jgi:glucose/arabinose dehydrogenase